MEEVNLQTIYSEILSVKKILLDIQEFVEDSFLTPEEEKLVKGGLANKNNFISSKDLKIELELADDIVQEIKISKNAPEEDFISNEDVLAEFKLK